MPHVGEVKVTRPYEGGKLLLPPGDVLCQGMVLLLGCLYLDQDDLDARLDVDQDGFDAVGLGGDDCDDRDRSVHPGSAEVCDGIDQDCDGVVDEDPLDGGTWFEDEDGDGWGSEQATTACRQPGQVAKAGDCDDQDDAIFPGQEESWYDGVDQACDGGDDFDADGDGAPLDEDCDDQDEGVFVGAPELCDSVDQDCDGALSPCTLDEPVLEGEQAGDYAGFSVAGPGDVDLDGVPDLLVGARGADAVYLVPGAGSQVLAEAPRLVGEVAGWAGVAVDGAGDTDGDGWPDLVVGARNDDLGGDDAGAAYLVRGPVGSGLLRDHVTLLGEGPGDNAGIAVAGPGDLDGDGLADLAVGARNHDAGGSNAGAVYLLFGPISSGTLGDEGVKLLGKQSGDLAGRSLAAGGDIDGDGQQDLLVGALFAHQAGTVYVVTDQDLDTELVGVEPDDGAGRSLAGVGDIDGDGLDDLIVGAPDASPNGASSGIAYLVLGPATVGTLALADASLLGENTGDNAGQSVTGADVNGDGVPDLVVGAYKNEPAGSDRGAVYVVFGPTSGTVELSGAIKLMGLDDNDQAGGAVSRVGDVDGDGREDLLVGAHQADWGGDNSGAAYLVLDTPLSSSM